MLHEIILSLLGFTGDIIIRVDDTFAVESSFELLSDAEKEQVNRIVRLGWYYDFTANYIRKNEMQWGGASGGMNGFQAYRAALCLAMGDVIEEYVEDVSELETKIHVDGPIPLSFVSQHVQKYFISMPAIYSICMEIDRQGLRGCQILDYVCAMRSGAPIVTAVIARMILRMRVVFLKQTLGWMLHGSLHDPGEEFYIQAKQIQSINGSADRIDGEVFDWTSSFGLRLEYLPESHVSPRLAAKIMFVGKAVKLLRHYVKGGSSLDSSRTDSQFSEGEQEILQYFGGNGGRDWVLEIDARVKQQDEEGKSNLEGSTLHEVRNEILIPGVPSDSILTPLLDRHTTQGSNGMFGDGKDIFNCDSYVLEVLQEQHKHWGLATGDVDKDGGLKILRHCALVFEDILCKPDLAVDLFEQLVEKLHDRASVQLWSVLKENSPSAVTFLSLTGAGAGGGMSGSGSCGKNMTGTHQEAEVGVAVSAPFRFGFFEYLHLLRNVFLLGKGEFYQAMLDNLLEMINDPLPLHSDTADQVDHLLRQKVLRKTARLLNLEEDSLCHMFTLRAQSSSASVSDFSSAAEVGDDGTKMSDVTLTGAAAVQPSKRGGSSVRLGEKIAPAKENSYGNMWKKHHLHPNKCGGEEKSLVNETRPSRVSTSHLQAALEYLRYETGSAWLTDEKYVGKGFSVTINFACGWNSIVRELVPGHPLMDYLSCIKHSHDRDGDGTEDDVADDVSVLSMSESGRGGRGLEQVEISLGCVSWVVYGGGALSRMGQKQQQQSSERKMSLGLQAQGSVSVGVSFHVRRFKGMGECDFFARVFVTTSPVYSFSSGGSVAVDTSTIGGGIYGGGRSVDGNMIGRESVQVVGLDEIQIYTGSLSSWKESPVRDLTKRSLSSSSLLCLEVEYTREIASSTASGASVGATGGDWRSMGSVSGVGTGGGGVVHKIKGRIREQGTRAAASDRWDVNVPVTLEANMRLHGGRSFVGVTCTGCVILPSTHRASKKDVARMDDQYTSASFYTDVNNIEFKGKGVPGSTASSITSTASSHIFARYPMVFTRLEECLMRYRLWLNLKLKILKSPKQLCTIFDADAMKTYGSLFSLLLKVRIVVYAMERRCVTSSSVPASASAGARTRTRGGLGDMGAERGTGGTKMSHLRHSMLFVLSNLLLYLQVDVIDAEYTNLVTQLRATNSFRSAYSLHRTFLATVARLAMVDNAIVQDAIERVIQVCLRYLAVSQVMAEMEQQQIAGASLSSFPPEELDALRRDFYTQVSYLFQIIRKVENRGFIFRLDFNGFLSEVSNSFSPAPGSHITVSAGSS